LRWPEGQVVLRWSNRKPGFKQDLFRPSRAKVPKCDPIGWTIRVP
jgi:hypothetical protein